ncbi:replication-relaxation family protein [Streptomyces beigongshangae]|uniref:replication-relaxation family protein n=1 Tax=Streptomyces beigongshangae TaxID=2841597 RepID=UPI001C85ED65|nr:replication-relaxation family protein [Streptomyces sp. REN17]
MAKRKTNEAGSSTGLRADVLRALGVLKAATADQIQRLSSPHLTYRHTTKKTAAARKEARTASHRGALNDLRRHGLSVDGGRTRGGEEVRLLTKDGLAAAGLELDRGPEEMGGMPKSAGRSGASHAMTVNETILAMIRPKPDPDLVAGEPAEAVAAAQAAVDAPDGIGTITSYATEVALPSTGTWKNPGVGGAWADIVLIAPEAGLPLLFIEADNCTEEAPIIAAKFDKYMRHFHRKAKDTDGHEKPMWRTRWSAPDLRWGDATHPPVLLVFHQVGKRSALKQMERVADLTREHWQGQWAEGGFRIYNGKMPIVATTLDLLREHGPAGPVFWRFGREGRQNLWEAIGNPRKDAFLARRSEDARRRQAQEAAEREAQRPVCGDCGQKFTDDRWKASTAVEWDHGDSHPHLCDDCKYRALEAEQQARVDERECQEQEHQEQEAAQAPKAGGWLGRRRRS